MSNRDPLNQLASLRIEADGDTRERDLEAIRVELRRGASAPNATPRRWTLGVVVALILAGPTAAIAADDALPGDALYPIKRIAEPIVQLFDRGVVVEHRVEEVAGLVDRQSDDVVIRQRIDIARDALAETDAPQMERELDRIVDRWITDRARDQSRDLSPPTTRPSQPAPPTDRRDQEPEPAPIDAPESTTTTTDRPSVTEPGPSDRTTTPTTAPDDRLPPDDRPRDTP